LLLALKVMNATAADQYSESMKSAKKERREGGEDLQIPLT
jgi:hypothetical protein